MIFIAPAFRPPRKSPCFSHKEGSAVLLYAFEPIEKEEELSLSRLLPARPLTCRLREREIWLGIKEKFMAPAALMRRNFGAYPRNWR